jgi:signal transduction histidine kinase
MLLFFVADQHAVLAISAASGALVTIGVMVTILIMLFDFARNSNFGLAMRIITCLVAVIFIVIVCRSMLLVLGVLEEGAFFLQSTVWRGVFMPLILMGFLWQRDRMQTRQLFQQKIDTAVTEVRAKDQALRLESQSQFMAMLMHELKTPLYIIQIAAASLSRHSDANSPDSKRLDNIGRAVDDLNFIIDQCVQADQLDQGDLPVNKTKVALKTLLSEVRHIKGYERITQAGISDAWVSTEFQYARIILINLITNALKYSPPGSPISLSVHTVPSVGKAFLTIRVSNTVGSAGRPDPNLVFTRYYRADGAKKAVGAGLGLWLAKSLATKLGSDLRLGTDETLVHFDFSLELS